MIVASRSSTLRLNHLWGFIGCAYWLEKNQSILFELINTKVPVVSGLMRGSIDLVTLLQQPKPVY
jgi:hypothetical protein